MWGAHPEVIQSQRKKTDTIAHGGVLKGSIGRRSAEFSACAIWKRQKQSILTC